MVFYPSATSGNFEIGISRLAPNQTYTYAGGEIRSDSNGDAKIDVYVDGRTEVHLKPAKA